MKTTKPLLVISVLTLSKFVRSQEPEEFDIAAIFRDDQELRAAPWWQAIKDETYYTQCQSSCTAKSKGVVTKIRLCDDTEVCGGRKRAFDEYATDKCKSWIRAKRVPHVTLLGEGRRFKPEPAKGNWISCAIFCLNDRNQWYSPRRELGREAFYPDGTWCHTDAKAGVEYYCQKNLCLPENYHLEDAVRAAESSINLERTSEPLVVDNEVLEV